MATTPGPDIFHRLETLIKTQSTDYSTALDVLTEIGAPIVSVGVLNAGNIAVKILGHPQPRDSTANSRLAVFNGDTLFQACSISKPITALAVIKLCQTGQLSLDVPISEYLTAEQLSWISTAKTHALVSQITLRLLLAHTSGLTVHGYAGYSTPHIPSLPQILTGSPPANNEPVKLFIFPGQKHSYSGGGFTVIQLLLENHFQKPFPEIMDEVILQPLNMTRSTYRILPTTEKNYAPVYLTGKQKADPDHYLQPESAAAGLWTTPGDLLKVVRALQASLKSGEFLERKWAQEMLKEVDENMALGWMVTKNGTCFWHPGQNDPGYNCVVMGYADLVASDETSKDRDEDSKGEKREVPTDCGICIMTSSALGDAVWAKILAAVPYLEGWPSPFERVVVPFIDRAKQVDERAKEWCGNWGPWGLVEKKGLSVRYGAFNAIQLLPAAIPPHIYDEGTSIDLAADGLEMMLRLGWKDGARIVEIWQDWGIGVLEQEKADDDKAASL